MKIKSLFLILVLSTTISFAQKSKTKITHFGNDYNIIIEENDNHNFDLYITNNSNNGLSKKEELNNLITESELEKTVYNNLNTITSSYVFIDKTIDSLRLKPKEIVDFDFSSIVGKINPNNIWLLKTFKEKIGYKKYNDFIKEKLTSQSVQLLTNLKIISDQKDNKTTYAFVYETQEEKRFTNEEEFESTFIELTNKNSSLLKNFYTEEYLKKLLINLSTKNSKIIANLHKSSIAEDGYNLLSNYKAENSNNTYEVSIKQDLNKNYFILRLCSSNVNECKYTIKLDLKIEPTDFKADILNTVKKIVDTEKFSDNDIDNLYIKCIKTNEIAVVKKESEPFKEELSNILLEIENEKTEYSGILKLNQEVNISKSDTVFKPKKAYFRVFNNKAQSIAIIGDLVDKNGDVISETISVNFSYSVPLRALINGGFSININSKNGKKIGIIDYGDIFNYYPNGKKFNFAAKNKEYEIIVNDTVKIEQRKFIDYFTPVFFTDFLGLNSNSSNSLILAEGKLKIPLSIYNCKYTSCLTALRANATVSLYNGFDDNQRVITEEKSESFTEANITVFDYVKNANLNADISLDIVSFEFKGLSTDLSFGTGIRYYRAAYKHTNTSAIGKDEIFTDQLNALAPEVNMNFQIRPQENIGADLTLAYSWLNPRGTNKNTTLNVLYTNSEKEKRLFQVNLDVYVKLFSKTKKGGAYFRLGGWYHQESKDFYPQLMVGYATNLTNFVNKFKGDN